MMSQDSQWHLSKSVPITFIFAIIMQTIALIWFVATLRNDVDINQRELLRLETRTSSLEQIVQSQAITLGRIDENIKSIRMILDSMAREK
jgi:hypothetical protein